MPKGVLHVCGAAENHRNSAEFAFGLRPGDIFWCTADPGWVTGTVYTIIATLPHGASVARPSETRAVDQVPLLGLMESKICAKRVDRLIIETID